MVKKNETTLKLAPGEVIMSRIINAPRELVFEAWTEAEHIEKWFGPRIFRTEAESDPRPGGAYRIAMIGNEKAPPEHSGPYPMKGLYKEFIKPEKVVFTQDLTDHPKDWKDLLQSKIKDYSGEDFLNTVTTVTFQDMGSQTKVTIITSFDSCGVRDAYISLGMKEGWAESLDKLEEMLS